MGWAVLLLAVRCGLSAKVYDKKNAGDGARALQTSSGSSDDLGDTGDTVVNGILELRTTDARDACEEGCTPGLAAAFGVDEPKVGCLCPDDLEARRRLSSFAAGDPVDQALLRVSPSLLEHPKKKQQSLSRNRSLRALAELDESVSAAFAIRITGGIEGGADSLDLFSNSGVAAVASAFGVEESEVRLGRERKPTTRPHAGDRCWVRRVLLSFTTAALEFVAERTEVFFFCVFVDR